MSSEQQKQGHVNKGFLQHSLPPFWLLMKVNFGLSDNLLLRIKHSPFSSKAIVVLQLSRQNPGKLLARSKLFLWVNRYTPILVSRMQSLRLENQGLLLQNLQNVGLESEMPQNMEPVVLSQIIRYLM